MEVEVNSIDYNSTGVEDYLKHLVDGDNLVDKWLLTRTPYPVLILLFIYFLFIMKIGPYYMENKSPYKLKIVMRVYNICQVLGNVRLIYSSLIVHAKNIPYIFHVVCNIPKTTDEDVEELRLAFLYLLHGYLVLKIMDLLDTVFMVLRKKNSQITFLHIYHHGIMVFGTWFTLKYLKPLQCVLPGLLNIMVHVVMYSYFFLATFGEPVKKYLWWKKYLTKLQMSQFVIILIYIGTLYYNKCPMNKGFTHFWILNVFVFLCLFVNFYVRTYVMKPKTVESEKVLKQKDWKTKSS